MTYHDLDYIRRIVATPLVDGPVLELGTGWGGMTSREVVLEKGLKYLGTDLTAGPGVDVAADFEVDADVARLGTHGPFGTVFVLNVLEHTFDPIRILDRVVGLTRKGGTIVTATPAVWPLHNFPMDAWRPLPNFYEEYARRRGLTLIPEWFQYLPHGPVASFRAADGSYSFPPQWPTNFGRLYGRVIHRLFNTFGRGMTQPTHVGIAAVFQVPTAG